MRSASKLLAASTPLAVALLLPNVAAAHPDNDRDVSVSANAGTVSVTIYNYHDFAISCYTTVNGGTISTMIGATSSVTNDHTGIPPGTYTASWTCPSDSRPNPTSHSSGSKTVTVAADATDNGNNTGGNGGNGTSPNKDLCALDFSGYLHRIGVCP